MNWADIALLVLIGLSTLVGFWRGFLSEVLSLVVWVAAFAAVLLFGDKVAEQLVNHVDSPMARVVIAYGLLFVGTLLIGGLINYLTVRAVRGTGLGGTDRLLGLAFGMVRGVALSVLLVLIAGLTPFSQEAWWTESRLVPSFQKAADRLAAMFPEYVPPDFDPNQLRLPPPVEEEEEDAAEGSS